MRVDGHFPRLIFFVVQPPVTRLRCFIVPRFADHIEAELQSICADSLYFIDKAKAVRQRQLVKQGVTSEQIQPVVTAVEVIVAGGDQGQFAEVLLKTDALAIDHGNWLALCIQQFALVFAVAAQAVARRVGFVGDHRWQD